MSKQTVIWIGSVAKKCINRFGQVYFDHLEVQTFQKKAEAEAFALERGEDWSKGAVTRSVVQEMECAS